MKINAELVLELRSQKAWSQEELAIAAGLNLRTIQRIEKDSTASLQSKKALASALDVDISDLDHEEKPIMKKYRYKVIDISAKEGFLAGIKKAKQPDLEAIFNREGQDGWRLVQIITPEIASAVWSMKTGKVLALLEQEISE